MASRKRYWLINKSPTRIFSGESGGIVSGGRMKKRRVLGVPTGSRRKAKRRPPKGFRTWKAYMASIRPNPKGGTVARRRRRRTTAAHRSTRRRRRRRNPPAVALANPRRRRRHHVAARRRRYTTHAFSAPRRRRRYHRNPSFRARGILREVKSAFGLAIQIEAGKLGTRVVRNYIPGTQQYKGKPLGLAIELGTAVALGYVASMVGGARLGANVLAGGVLATIESAIAQYRVPVLYDAVSDDGATMTVPAASASNVAGYVRDMGGYVPPGLGDVGGGSSIPELSFAGV